MPRNQPGRITVGKLEPILVQLKSGRRLLDLIAIKQDLEDLLGREVDVLTEEAVIPYIREQVLRKLSAYERRPLYLTHILDAI